ncbi:transmembrane protein, putative, partial [Bodo saltans]
MEGGSFLSGGQLASSISINNSNNNRSNNRNDNPQRIINGSEIAATVHWLGSHPLDPHCPVRQHGRYNASFHERLIMLNTVLNVVFGIFNSVHECADPPNDPNDPSLFYRYPSMDHFCESTMQLQPLFLLSVLTTTNLSPLRAVILVPLYSVLLAVYFAIRWIPGVPYGTTAVQYWSLALIVSLETLGCIAISIVREVRARRRFEHHVERFLLCVQTERTRRKIESMADTQIPLVFLRHAIDKTKAGAQQQPSRHANQHFGGDIPPYTFQNSRGVVCMFSIAGFGPWSSRRGPSDYIQVLQQVHEVYDRTLRELVRMFQSRVPPSAKKHSVIGKVKQQRKRSVLGTSSSSLKSLSLALLTGVGPMLRVYKVHTLGDVFMLVGCYVQEHQVQQRASTAMTDADGSTTTVQQRRQFSGVTLSPVIAYETAVNPLVVPPPDQNALVQQRSPQQNSLGPTATAAARRQSSSPREGSTPVVAPAIGDQAAQASQHLLVLPRSQSFLSAGQQDSASASGSYNPLMPETPQQLSSPRGGGGGGGGSGRASPLPMIATLKSPRSSAVAAPITDMNAVAIVGAGGGGGGGATSTLKRLSLAQLEHQKQRQQHHEYQLQILVQRVCVALERVSNVLPEAVDGLEWQSIDSNEEASRLRPVAVVVEGAVGLTMHKDTKNVIGFGAGVDQATKLLKRVVIATYPSHQRSLFPNTDVPVGNLSTESAQTTSIGSVGIDRGIQRDLKLFPLPRGILVLRLSSSTVATDVCDDAGWLAVHKSPAATGTSAAEVVVPSGIGSSSLRGTGAAHNSTRHLSIISQLGPGGSGSTRGQGEGGSNGVSQRGTTPASSLVIRRHQSQSISSFSHSGSQHPQDATTTTAARDDEVKPSPGHSSPANVIGENARAATAFVTSLPFSRHIVAAFATTNILKSSTRITSNPPRCERGGGDERGATGGDGQQRLTSTALSSEDNSRTSRRVQLSSFPADAREAGPAAALGHERSLFVVIVVRHLDEHLAKRRSITAGNKQQQRQSLSTSTPSPAAPPATSTALPAMLTIHDTMALLAPIGSGTSYIHGGGGVVIVGGGSGGGPNLMAASGYMSSSWAANNNNNNLVATTSASTQPSSLAEPQHPFASARSPHHRRLSSSSFQAGTVVTNSVISPPGIPYSGEYSISPTGPVITTTVGVAGEPPTTAAAGGAGGAPLQEAPVGGPRQIQQPQPRLSFWLPPPMLSVQRPHEPDIVLPLGNVVNDNNNRLPVSESALEDVAAAAEGEGDETTMTVVDPYSLGSGNNNNAIYRAAARLELTWSWRDISFTFFDPTTETFYWTITTSWDSVTVDMIFSLAACSLTFIGMIGACLIDGTAHSLFSRTMYDDDCELLGEDPRDYYTLRQPIFWGFIGVGVSWLFIASTMIVFPEHRRIFLKQLLAKMSVVTPQVVVVTASLNQASTAPATTPKQHRNNNNKNANNTPSSLPRILGFVCSMINQLIFFLAIAFSTGE